MKRLTKLSDFAGRRWALIALAFLVVSSCTRATPTGPTSELTGPPSVAGQSSATTTDWACFTAGPAGIFGSTEPGCSQTRPTPGFSDVVPGPTGTLSSTVNGNTVTLTWSAPTTSDPATSYQVEAGSSAGATNIAIFDTGNAATTLVVPGVPAGMYFVRVRGKNSSGVGAASNETLLTVGGGPGPCVGAPNAPTGLTAGINGSTVTFNWGAPAGGCPPTAYRIEVGSTSGASNLATVVTGNAATSFAAPNVPNGTYFVRVHGLNGSAVGVTSNEVTFTIGTPGPGAGLTGRWIGLVANGQGLSSLTSSERWDWQLDLTQTSATTVTGMLTQTDVLPPCGSNCRVQMAPLTGTISGNNFEFTIPREPGRGDFTGNTTFTATQISGTLTLRGSVGATLIVTRQ